MRNESTSARKWLALGLVAVSLAFLLVAVGAALAATSPNVKWWNISGGGAPATGARITLNDTLGQPITGLSSGGNTALGAGYWYGAGFDETRCDLTTGLHSFNQTWPVQVDIKALGTIDCIRVRRYDQDHLYATGSASGSGAGWGRYWAITAVDSGGSPAAGFTLTLTLPHNGLTSPKACRYPGNQGGAGWSCDDGTHTTFTANTVTRSGITELSEWAVGNQVNPNAVRAWSLEAFRGDSSAAPLYLLVGLVALGGVAGGMAWRRRAYRQGAGHGR
jgi:hypothetical protein